MKKDEHISEEQLNALIDGELDSEEGSTILSEAEQSAELDQRLCQQRKLKELVKHAYQDVPEPRRFLARKGKGQGMFGMAIAASVLILLGVTSGLFLRGFLDPAPQPQTLAATGGNQAVAAPENYILHVINGEPEQMKLALQKTRQLLDAAETGQYRQVEIVANEKGLDLLRSDITPYAEEISALSDENVIFYACSKAIQRLEEKGVEVLLVPEAIPGYTALDRVVIRMKDGWQYIKI
jgi:intracellular sulfur oxidation DsrE/DsrF family protein